MAGQCWLQMPLPGWSESQLRGFQVFISSARSMLELPADPRASLPLTFLRISLSFPMTWFLQLHPQQVDPLGCPSWLPTCGCACRAASQRAAWEALSVRGAIRQRGSPCEQGRDTHVLPPRAQGGCEGLCARELTEGKEQSKWKERIRDAGQHFRDDINYPKLG